MSERLSQTLCFAGLLLFALGLVTGFAIPRFTAPRIGLSAHLTAIQAGLALVVLGLLWSRLALRAGWDWPLAIILMASFYLVWIGLVLGAAWGTGRPLPIAGAGHLAARWQDAAAALPIAAGSIGALAAIVAILVQWRWSP